MDSLVTRPLIAIPARFSASASALRFAAEVNARALVEAVYRAGGEPFTMHPAADSDVAERLARCAGLLLPGGGDIAPRHYGGVPDDSVYDVDEEQDAFDFALARHALAVGLPTLAVCRGLQVVNTVLGGTLHRDQGGHRHVVQDAGVESGSLLAAVVGADKVRISCFHHQCVDRLGAGLVVSARAADGTVEAVERRTGAGWFLGVQWHPEDLPDGQAVFAALVAEASRVPPFQQTPTCR
ncbi:gamma-glutamyl-gamma-aminobutyrate hydrolase family protein [Actinoallomurus sp. CA-150999]|uniref:gamma-glutamyl-gamma-aminobutyrate hydrolase family protein n=1 Tax=Actinoallomurus sp. CA-150999 TaxID=3239887 RepID=UPI003D919AB7